MLIVVGGHSRNVGKTSVMCGVIASTRAAGWEAIKITQFGHHVCNTAGQACGCDPGDPAHPYAVDEQKEADDTDTGRYLQAGAVRAWWLRTAQGQLGHALPELKRLIRKDSNIIVESNSLLRFFQPDLYIVALDYAVTDMKDSSRLYLDRASAFVIQNHGLSKPPWRGVPERWFQGKPVFTAEPPCYVSAEMEDWLRLLPTNRGNGS